MVLVMQTAIEREHIGIFGKMNAGKSSLMNLLTQQETSIVDPAPGTTADTKVALLEIHGLGPVKLFDTPGVDESSGLGGKKRARALADLKECDLVLLVIDPRSGGWTAEAELLEKARELDKQVLVVYNLFAADAAAAIARVEEAIPLLKFHRKIALPVIDARCRPRLLDFILAGYVPKREEIELLPFVERDNFYVLNITMDEETPPGRLLRPQSMAEEHIVRRWAWPVVHRLDLRRARAGDPAERGRFESLLRGLGRRPGAVITDSRAMDVISRWTPADIPLTTFSIMMINHGSRGRLARFVAGLGAADALRPGDKVLIAEACNHSRIAEDIGTVQIPAIIARRWPGVEVEHSFGRQFGEDGRLESYKLVIHCGGCMIAPQKLLARIRDLDAVGVPYTNYGVFLSYAQGRAALCRALAPWGIVLPPVGAGVGGLVSS
jgi:[FeFe] hydrogenase H-cluster maturation GTPase HydF